MLTMAPTSNTSRDLLPASLTSTAPAAGTSQTYTDPTSLHPLSSSTPTRAPAKHRASHACDRCRLLRTKCSGDDPCHKCRKDEAICLFGDRKRERNKKNLIESVQFIDELKAMNNTLLQALKGVAISPNLDPTESASIRDVINTVGSTIFILLAWLMIVLSASWRPWTHLYCLLVRKLTAALEFL